MRIFKRILWLIIILVIGIVLVLFFVVRNISTRAIPDYSKAFKIKNLTDSVWVYRDSFAVPHIYARNQVDLYRVVGYLSAQDRLWQMDLLRHVTTGRLSEIFGKDLLEADALMRSLRIPEKSARIYDEISPEMKAIFEAYSDGVNQYIETNQSKLPPEFAILRYNPEPWKPIHCFNLVGYMAWDLNGSWVAEVVLHKLKLKLGMEKIKELVPSFDSTLQTIYSDNPGKDAGNWGTALFAANQKMEELGLTIFNGSNNWAVNGAHSADGKPLLANDMHLSLNAPGIWTQMHQVVDGQLDVTGVLLPGEPFIVTGHNAKIAWGMTNVMNDDIDFYCEQVNPVDSNQYFYNGNWKPFILRQEKIAIKGGDTLIKTIRFTHRGPVISALKGISKECISMHWLGNEWSNEVKAVYLLNRAGNWEEFKNALHSFSSVSQNVVYADTAGNIGLYCSAGVYKRKGPAWDVLSGNSDEYDWKEAVPFDSLPHYYNPADGLAVSANNKTASDQYPYYISYWYDLPFRFNRIQHMLQQENKHTTQSFESIQTDYHSEQVEYYLPGLLETLKNSHLSVSESNAFHLLQGWKADMNKSEAAPAIYETFFSQLIEELYKDEMGESLFKEFISDKILVRNAVYRAWTGNTSAFSDNINTRDRKESLKDIVEISFKKAVAGLEGKLGKDMSKWEWGEIHQISFIHPLGKVSFLNRLFHLNRGPFPVGGSYHTVEPYSYKFSAPFDVYHGASQRHIYSAGNWDNSWVIIPTGVSGIPSSNYYCDQTSRYLANQYKHDWFSKDKVIKNARYSIVLTSGN